MCARVRVIQKGQNGVGCCWSRVQSLLSIDRRYPRLVDGHGDDRRSCALNARCAVCHGILANLRTNSEQNRNAKGATMVTKQRANQHATRRQYENHVPSTGCHRVCLTAVPHPPACTCRGSVAMQTVGRTHCTTQSCSPPRISWSSSPRRFVHGHPARCAVARQPGTSMAHFAAAAGAPRGSNDDLYI